MSEPTHYSSADFIVAYGLMIALAVVVCLVSKTQMYDKYWPGESHIGRYLSVLVGAMFCGPIGMAVVLYSQSQAAQHKM